MKAKYTFEFVKMDDCRVAVPVGDGADQFHGVLKVNETGMAILKLLENEISEEQIVEGIMDQFEGDPGQIREHVMEFLDTLKEEGLID